MSHITSSCTNITDKRIYKIELATPFTYGRSRQTVFYNNHHNPPIAPDSSIIILNRGTGAGGNLTNMNGKAFEYLTDNEMILATNGFVKVLMNKTKFGYYLTNKIISNTNPQEIIFVKQNGLKIYLKKMHAVDIFRCPDEAYVMNRNDTIHIKILEKKEQSVDGSVETKLWSAPALKREYELSLGLGITVDYALCVNSFLQAKLTSTHKKYTILAQILQENNITVLYGNEPSYFDTLDKWINS